jgi:DMSO/TMAO reductase YedYZ molybdopterin-dependent catalytic subunit
VAEELLAHATRPENWATPLEAFDRLITPTPLFFVRSHFGPPSLRRDRRLRITGMVERPLDLAVADLQKLEEVTVTAVLQCAGNGRALHEPRVPGVQWLHGAMGQATWTGVRLVDLLNKAGIKAGAAQVALLGADLPPKPSVSRYRRGLPIARALDPSTLIVYRMNGEPLSLAHGAPLRLVVPCWTGNHWVKWLTEIHVQSEPADGFYMETAYRWPKQLPAPGTPVAPADTIPLTTFPVKSIIARPREGSMARVGRQEIVGVAFSGEAKIAKVEILIEGNGEPRWSEAVLEGEPGVGRWQLFRYQLEAKTPGAFRAVARATDGAGRVQPQKAMWNPSGYLWNAYHAVSWTVG